MVYGFAADINELADMQDNPSLWIPLGVMTNVGDSVLSYKPVGKKRFFGR